MGDKVGIITLGGRFNYGNRLQNYATEYIWKTLGYEPTSLYLGVRPNAIRAMKKVFRVIMRKTEPNPEAGMRKHRLAAFDRFDRNMNNRFLKSIDPECIREFRFFSVGSDQTWNPSQFAYNEDWFFWISQNLSRGLLLRQVLGWIHLHRNKRGRFLEA